MTRVLGWLRGLLAVGLLAGFYGLAAVLIAVNLALAVLVLWGAFSAPTPNGTWGLVLAASIAAVSALVYAVATVSRTPDRPAGAVFLRRREAPALWGLVEELAGQLDTRPPRRLYLTSEANASVWEEARWLGFAVGTRTMYIGAPLLTQLPPAQLRAVLCHELGHYAGRHTAFGAVIYRGAAALQEALFRLRMTARSGTGYTGFAWFYAVAIGGYAWVYLRLSLAVRRRQELAADAAAVAAAGSAATAEALRTGHALGAAWAGFLDRFIRPVQRLGFVPADLFAAFATMMDDPAVRTRLGQLRAHPVEPGRSPLDSHPPLARRLALIEERPAGDPDPVEHGSLLADPGPLHRVQRELVAEGEPATRLPQRQWADLAAEAFAIEPAACLLAAARGAAVADRATLGTVLDLLERGEAAELGAQLTDDPEPIEQLAEALYALVGQALVGAGRARWVLSWTEGYRLACDGRTGGQLAERTAAAAADPAAVAGLRGELVRIGLDVARPVPLALRTVAAPAGRIAGARITARTPDFVAQELARQRTVRTVTLVLVGILSVPWAITTFGSDRSASPRSTAAEWRQSVDQAASVPPPGANPRPTLDPGWIAPSLPRPRPSLPPISLPDSVLAPPPRAIEIERGDTLALVACRYETTVAELQALNDLGTREDIYAGDTLLVPARVLVRTDCG